ncbi:hypothetical protein LCGC14_0329630 [marine sediment metagenome]|uniref:Uncharacterized protein n=1 Tax=marine sediment metagenome TaxID=412755 RepID=A0A0F9TGL9_9ZZZZ
MPQDAQDSNPVQNIPASAVPPQLASAPHPYTQQLTTLVTDGKEEQVTHEELVRRAQMGVSSENRYREASDKSKEAESAINFKADMDLLAETGDISAFRRAGAAMNLSGSEIEEAARIVYESNEEPSPGSEGFDENDLYDNQPQGGGNPASGNVGQQLAALSAQVQKLQGQLTGKQTGFGDLSEDLQTVIGDAEQIRVDKIIQNVLDSDDVLSYYMSSYDKKGQTAIRSMIDDKVRGRLDASDGKFGDGTRIMREIVPEVKEHLEALGTPNRSTPQMGLGPAPGGQSGADIYPRKQPDHIPSTEAGFEEHIGETLAHNLFKAQQSGQ